MRRIGNFRHLLGMAALSAVLVLIFTSCSGFPLFDSSSPQRGETSSSGEAAAKKATETAPQKRAVSVSEVEDALVQLTIRMNIPAQFERYTAEAATGTVGGEGSALQAGAMEKGDPSVPSGPASQFEESIAVLFALEEGPLPKNGGLRRAVYRESGDVYHSFTRFACENGEGVLWRCVHSVEGDRTVFEVLLGPEGIPREIRYSDPAAGAQAGEEQMQAEQLRRRTSFDIELQQYEEGPSRAEYIRSFLREKRSIGREMLPPYYRDLQIVGTAEIEEAGRTVEAVHLSRSAAEGAGLEIHVRYARAVPGGVLRVMIGQNVKKVGIEEWDVSYP